MFLKNSPAWFDFSAVDPAFIKAWEGEEAYGGGDVDLKNLQKTCRKYFWWSLISTLALLAAAPIIAYIVGLGASEGASPLRFSTQWWIAAWWIAFPMSIVHLVTINFLMAPFPIRCCRGFIRDYRKLQKLVCDYSDEPCLKKFLDQGIMPPLDVIENAFRARMSSSIRIPAMDRGAFGEGSHSTGIDYSRIQSQEFFRVWRVLEAFGLMFPTVAEFLDRGGPMEY